MYKASCCSDIAGEAEVGAHSVLECLMEVALEKNKRVVSRGEEEGTRGEREGAPSGETEERHERGEKRCGAGHPILQYQHIQLSADTNSHCMALYQCILLTIWLQKPTC